MSRGRATVVIAVVAVAVACLGGAGAGQATSAVLRPGRVLECTGPPLVKIEAHLAPALGPNGTFYQVSYGGSWQSPMDETNQVTANFTVKDETGKVWQTYSGPVGMGVTDRDSYIGTPRTVGVIVLPPGKHTFTVTFSTPCGTATATSSVIVPNYSLTPKPKAKPTTKKTPAPAGTTGGYPWADAVCVYGSKGGAKCTDPSGKNGSFNWGYKINGRWQQYNAKNGGWVYRNCTDYVAWRLKISAGTFHGDAVNWKDQAAKRTGWAVTHTPTKGDIAWWKNYDHVAVVTGVHKNGKAYTADVAEYNWPVNGKYGIYGTRSNVTADAYLHRLG